MKTIVKNAIVIMLLFISMMSMAQDKKPVKFSSTKSGDNTEIKILGQSYQVTQYNVANGKIEGRIWDGTSSNPGDTSVKPVYKVMLYLNPATPPWFTPGMIPYRTIDNIPDNTTGAYNFIFDSIPTGKYKIWGFDHANPPNDARASNDWLIMSPPFATMNGTVNPMNRTTTAWFEYGESIAYGNVAQLGSLNGEVAIPVTLQIKSGLPPPTFTLVPGHTYHYRIAAQNSAGTSYGQDQLMVIPLPASPPVVVTLPATGISLGQ
jgi:hypothetical protein